MAQAAWKWMALVAVLGGGVFVACSDDSDGGGPDGQTDAGTSGTGENKFRPGLGDDEGTPEGTPFNFPSGIQLASATILGEDASEGECEGATIPPAGSGGAVWACMQLTNTTSLPIEVELPPGLMLLSDYREGQHGLLVERVNVLVPPGSNTGGIDAGTDGGTGTPTAFIVPLHLYCLNESLGPSSDRQPYTLGPVTSDPDLLELLALLAGKRIDTEEEKTVVQRAIYHITEGKGLTREDRDDIARIR